MKIGEKITLDSTYNPLNLIEIHKIRLYLFMHLLNLLFLFNYSSLLC